MAHTNTQKHKILFVHGAWHGAWCWSGVQAALNDRGIASYAVDLPGNGIGVGSWMCDVDMYGHAEYVAGCVRNLNERVVLVGHSYGGIVISQVAMMVPELVSHLCYLAAFCPNENESLFGIISSLPPSDPPIENFLQAIQPSPHHPSFTILNPIIAEQTLFHDCTQQQTQAALARLTQHQAQSATQPVTGNPRHTHTISSTYIVCTMDKVIPTPSQEILAKRCDVREELNASHSPFLSQPQALADILERMMQTCHLSEERKVNQ